MITVANMPAPLPPVVAANTGAVIAVLDAQIQWLDAVGPAKAPGYRTGDYVADPLASRLYGRTHEKVEVEDALKESRLEIRRERVKPGQPSVGLVEMGICVLKAMISDPELHLRAISRNTNEQARAIWEDVLKSDAMRTLCLSTPRVSELIDRFSTYTTGGTIYSDLWLTGVMLPHGAAQLVSAERTHWQVLTSIGFREAEDQLISRKGARKDGRYTDQELYAEVNHSRGFFQGVNVSITTWGDVGDLCHVSIHYLDAQQRRNSATDWVKWTYMPDVYVKGKFQMSNVPGLYPGQVIVLEIAEGTSIQPEESKNEDLDSGFCITMWVRDVEGYGAKVAAFHGYVARSRVVGRGGDAGKLHNGKFRIRQMGRSPIQIGSGLMDRAGVLAEDSTDLAVVTGLPLPEKTIEALAREPALASRPLLDTWKTVNRGLIALAADADGAIVALEALMLSTSPPAELRLTVSDRVAAFAREAKSKAKGKGKGKKGHCKTEEDTRSGNTDAHEGCHLAWREKISESTMSPKWKDLILDIGPWMGGIIAKALRTEDPSLLALGLQLLACAATGTCRTAMKGGAGSGKTFTVLMLGLVFAHETRELMVIDSSQNANLADLAGTIACYIPKDANLAKRFHRFPSMADLNNANTGMTPIDVVPAERQGVIADALIIIITTGSVCNQWRAKEPGRETMTRAARWLVVDEAQMQWRAADIAALSLVMKDGLTLFVGDHQQPRGPATGEADRKVAEFAHAHLKAGLFAPGVRYRGIVDTIRIIEGLWDIPNDAPRHSDKELMVAPLTPAPLAPECTVSSEELVGRIIHALNTVICCNAPVLSKAQAMGLTAGIPSLELPNMRRCGPGITMLMSSSWYRHSYSGLKDATGPYQSTIGAGRGPWGIAGLGRDRSPAVWYELPFLSSSGMDRRKTATHERTLMVPATRHMLDAVIGKFAGITAGDLREGAGGGLQVVASIADIAHYIMGIGEGEPPSSVPESCRQLGNRTWEQVIQELAEEWGLHVDLSDPTATFKLIRQAPWLTAQILLGNQALSAPGIQGQICIHVIQSPTAFQINDKQSLVGTTRGRRYQVTIGNIKGVMMSAHPETEAIASYARTMYNMGYVVQHSSKDAYEQVRGPLPHVLEAALVGVAAQVTKELHEEARMAVTEALEIWEKGHGWAVLANDRNGEALRAFDKIVALASGRPPPELALPICLDIPIGTIAVASRLLPWLGGLYRITPENGSVKRFDRMLPRHSLRDLPRIPDARISLFPDGKVKLRIGKVEIAGSGKLGGHIDWLRSGELGSPLNSPGAISSTNKHVGFIHLFPMSGDSWRRGNAHGLKAEVRSRVFGVITPGIDLNGPWHPIPFASPDGVRSCLELGQDMPFGDDYAKALHAIMEAAAEHASGPILTSDDAPGTGANEQSAAAQGGGVADQKKIPTPHVTRATDLSVETGGMASAYADTVENEDADEEMGTLTPVEIEEQYRHEIGIWAGLQITGNVIWTDELRFYEEGRVSAMALSDTMDFNTPWLRLVFKFPFCPIRKTILVNKAVAALGIPSQTAYEQQFEEMFANILHIGIMTALQGSAPNGLERAMKPIADKAARPGGQHLQKTVEALSGCWDAIFTPQGMLQHLRATLQEDVLVHADDDLRQKKAAFTEERKKDGVEFVNTHLYKWSRSLRSIDKNGPEVTEWHLDMPALLAIRTHRALAGHFEELDSLTRDPVGTEVLVSCPRLKCYLANMVPPDHVEARQSLANKIKLSTGSLAPLMAEPGGKKNSNRGEQICTWLRASLEMEHPRHIRHVSKSSDDAAPFVMDVRLAGTDALKVPTPPLGRDLQAPVTMEETNALRDYITHMSIEDIRAQATDWWESLGSRRFLAEDEEFQALQVVEENDERSLARRVYRKRVIRSLLAKGHTPTRTNAFLLDMAKIVEDAVGSPYGTWHHIMEEASRHAPPPLKKEA